MSPTLVLHQLGWGIPHAMWHNHAYAFYLDSITNSNGNTKFSLAWTVTFLLASITLGLFTSPVPIDVLSHKCPVNNPLNVLRWFLLSLSNSPAFFCAGSFLRKPLGCLCPPMDCQYSLCFLLIQSLINLWRYAKGRFRSGSGIAETWLANWSAVSLPSIPRCPSTHTSSILLCSASFTRHWWQSQTDLEFIWICPGPW